MTGVFRCQAYSAWDSFASEARRFLCLVIWKTCEDMYSIREDIIQEVRSFNRWSISNPAAKIHLHPLKSSHWITFSTVILPASSSSVDFNKQSIHLRCPHFLHWSSAIWFLLRHYGGDQLICCKPDNEIPTGERFIARGGGLQHSQ